MTSQAAGKAALTLAVAIVALGATGAKGASIPGDDARFLQKAAAHGHAEIRMGELAKSKAMREEVRQFADRMVADHTKAIQDITAVGSTNGVQLPTGPDEKHTKAMGKLEKLSGGDFDRAYMKAMVKDHREDVQAFRRKAKTRHANDVTQFAARTEPVLLEHLRMAEKTYDITMEPKRTGKRETGSNRP